MFHGIFHGIYIYITRIYWDFQWKSLGYPLVNIQKAIEHGPIEIVSFPIKHCGSFHSFLYVYQRYMIYHQVHKEKVNHGIPLG